MSDFLEELYGAYGDNDLSRSIDAQSNSATSGYGQNIASNINSDVEQPNVAMNSESLNLNMAEPSSPRERMSEQEN